MKRKRFDCDAGLQPWLVELFDAGRDLAELVEHQQSTIEKQDDGSYLARLREDWSRVQHAKLTDWACAVVAAREAAGRG